MIWGGGVKILQYSEKESNCAWKFTEGLLRKYSTLWQHICESPITDFSVKHIIHLGRMPPNCWGPRLQSIEPIGKSGTGIWKHQEGSRAYNFWQSRWYPSSDWPIFCLLWQWGFEELLGKLNLHIFLTISLVREGTL